MIRIITVGNVKKINSFIDHYMKQMKQVSIKSVKEEKNNNVNIIKKKEGERLLKKLKGDYSVALSEDGEQVTSIEFAALCKQYPNLTFLVGGAFGLSEEVKKKSDMVLSLGKMTFPHDIALLLLVEQVYRSKMINSSRKYHK